MRGKCDMLFNVTLLHDCTLHISKILYLFMVICMKAENTKMLLELLLFVSEPKTNLCFMR